MAELQRELLRTGQHLPRFALDDADDLVRQATVTASSELRLGSLPDDNRPVTLDVDRGQLLPLPAGPVPQVGLRVDVAAAGALRVELRRGLRADDYTPDQTLAVCTLELDPGPDQLVKLDFDTILPEAAYVTLCLMADDRVAVHVSDTVVTGLVPLRHRTDQPVDDATGCPGLEFWAPVRRPEGRNLALSLDPPVLLGAAVAVANGVDRPTGATNAWIADLDDPAPALDLTWAEPQTIGRLELRFDSDFDHAMESVLYTQPEAAMPHCVRDFTVTATHDGVERVLAAVRDHHQSNLSIRLDAPLTTDRLRIAVHAVNGKAPAAIFSVRAYADADSRILRGDPVEVAARG